MKKTTTRLAGVALAVLLAGGALTACTSTPDNAQPLPSALPETVEVVDGDVSNQVADPESGTWSFTVTVADEKAQQAAITEMTDAGWEIVDESEGDTESVYALTNEKQNATIKLTTIGDDRVVVYNVIAIDE